MKLLSQLIALLSLFILSTQGHGCTRILYTGSDDVVITGRSMDWTEDIFSNLWVFPRGMKRDGAAGSHSITWTSKYGSVIVSGYEAGTADGMNEKGVVASVLYLAESDYGVLNPTKAALSTLAWGQYALDNFASVAEAVTELKKEPFQIFAPKLPNGDGAQFHLALSDSTGDSAIFEYIRGSLVIHHGKEYHVMTNSPSYDQQLTLNDYWKEIGGSQFLPGTSRAADRFVRSSFYLGILPRKTDPHFIQAIPQKSFENQAIASVTSLMRSVSVPLGFTTPDEPNIASTLWRTISDQKNRIYYFDSSTSPNIFWVAFSDIDFSEAGGVKKLKVAGGEIYAGNVAKEFVAAQPFTFLSPTLKK